jgi:hypothetical protein
MDAASLGEQVTSPAPMILAAAHGLLFHGYHPRQAAPRSVSPSRRPQGRQAPSAHGALVTVDDARSVASTLPRSYEAVVRDQVRFRVGRIVYAAFSPDETLMGFAFPKEERDALVASKPDKFLLPSRPSSATTGSASDSTRSTPTNSESSSSTRGECASQRRSQLPTTGETS